MFHESLKSFAVSIIKKQVFCGCEILTVLELFHIEAKDERFSDFKQNMLV